MRRDMDLIRELMLALEAMEIRPGSVWHIDPYEGEMAIEGYTAEEIDGHLALLSRSGYLISGDSGAMRGILFKGFEWAGHDFLDSVRDPEIWQATKQTAEKVKGFSFDLLVALAKGVIKKKIADVSGIEINF